MFPPSSPSPFPLLPILSLPSPPLALLIWRIRCFSFGIGSGASTHLVKGIAEAGLGTAEFITGGERMQPKVYDYEFLLTHAFLAHMCAALLQGFILVLYACSCTTYYVCMRVLYHCSPLSYGIMLAYIYTCTYIHAPALRTLHIACVTSWSITLPFGPCRL